MSNSDQDPRAEKTGICGVTTFGGTGIEWICVKPVHAKVYERRVGDYNHRRGSPIYNNNPQVDYHYFVPRWLNRKLGDAKETDF